MSNQNFLPSTSYVEQNWLQYISFRISFFYSCKVAIIKLDVTETWLKCQLSSVQTQHDYWQKQPVTTALICNVNKLCNRKSRAALKKWPTQSSKDRLKTNKIIFICSYLFLFLTASIFFTSKWLSLLHQRLSFQESLLNNDCVLCWQQDPEHQWTGSTKWVLASSTGCLVLLGESTEYTFLFDFCNSLLRHYLPNCKHFLFLCQLHSFIRRKSIQMLNPEAQPLWTWTSEPVKSAAKQALDVALLLAHACNLKLVNQKPNLLFNNRQLHTNHHLMSVGHSWDPPREKWKQI